MNGDRHRLTKTLDLNPTHHRRIEFLLDEVTDLDVFVQPLCVVDRQTSANRDHEYNLDGIL